MNRTRSALVVLLLGALAAGPVRASCGTASCPLDLDGLDRGADTAPRLHLAYEVISQDQPRHGATDVAFQAIRRPDHDEIETVNHNWTLQAALPLGRRWSLGLVVPVVQRRHAHVAVEGHAHDDDADTGAPHEHSGIERWEFTRLGDIVAGAEFRPFAGAGPAGALHLGLGLRLPTGATDVANAEGTLAEPTLQPGTGNLGAVVDIGCAGSAHDGRLDWFVSSRSRWNAAGRQGYRIGPEWTTTAGVRRSLSPRIDLLAQAAARWRGSDDAGHSGEAVDATGRRALYLSPGLGLDLAHGVRLDGYWQVPLYERVHGLQLTADHNLMLGIAFAADPWY